jgi:hypothetical protein
MQPEYVAYDNKQREEFLSQLGNFSPNERDVFHKLCQNWQEAIPYDRFSRLLTSGEGGNSSDLISLMNKLRAERLGILRTTITEGNRSRKSIVLTAASSPRFYSELVDELFTDMLESIVNPLPLASILEKQLGSIPIDLFRSVPANQLAPYLATGEESGDDAKVSRDEGDPPDEPPLSVQSLNSDSLLITRKNLRPFMTVAILKMRYYLSNTTLLGAVAKLQDTSLLAIKKGCNSKDSLFWLALTNAIVSHVREIEALRNVGIDASFYHVAWLLKNLIESQRAEADEKRRRQEEEELDLEAIAMAIKESPTSMLSQEELSTLIQRQSEKYGDRFDHFRNAFFERYVRDKTSKKLPVIVQLETNYIHRDNLFPLFLEHFRKVEAELRPYFVHRMEHQLRSGNRNRDETFYSAESFEDAIREQVSVHSKILAQTIKRPAILAEGMIHHARKNKLVKDVDELKKHLSLYFEPDTMKPLPLSQWFNLRLAGVFEQAFERLPVFQRIWIRITGKYESFRGRFIDQGVKGTSGVRKSSDRASGARNAPSRSQRKRTSGRNAEGRPTPSHRRRPTAAEGSRRSAAASGSSTSSGASKPMTEEQKKQYNRKQVDSAWEQFGSTIKK